MTDMGRIAIEGVIETDPVHPISLRNWKSNDLTSNWKSSQHNEIADYYVQIGIHPNASMDYIHLLSIAALMHVKLYYAVHYHVTYAYIDAAVLSYINETERDPELYISNMQKEFMNLHYMLRPNKLGIELAHYMMKERIAKAVQLTDKVEKQFYAKSGDSYFNFLTLALIYDLRMAS